jgi:hypothetical protein
MDISGRVDELSERVEGTAEIFFVTSDVIMVPVGIHMVPAGQHLKCLKITLKKNILFKYFQIFFILLINKTILTQKY